MIRALCLLLAASAASPGPAGTPSSLQPTGTPHNPGTPYNLVQSTGTSHNLVQATGTPHNLGTPYNLVQSTGTPHNLVQSTGTQSNPVDLWDKENTSRLGDETTRNNDENNNVRNGMTDLDGKESGIFEKEQLESDVSKTQARKDRTIEDKDGLNHLIGKESEVISKSKVESIKGDNDALKSISESSIEENDALKRQGRKENDKHNLESQFGSKINSTSESQTRNDSGSAAIDPKSNSKGFIDPKSNSEVVFDPRTGLVSRSSASTNSSTADCTLVPSDLMWYFCGDQQLKIKDKVLMEVVCDRAPLSCSSLPPRPRGRLDRLEVTDCPLPPSLRLACVGGSAAALALSQAPSPLSAENVEGLDAEDVFIMARPGAIREIPVAAIRALPRLQRFRLLQGSNISLSPEQFPPSPLRYLEVSMSGVMRLPRAAFARLRRLRTLSLFRNHIQHVHPEAFIGLDSLQTLILDNNPLTALPPGALPPSLTTLYLQGVGLTALHEGVISGLQHLEKIVVSSSGTLVLGARALSALPALTFASVSRSRVTSLPPDLFLHSPALLNLTLSHNSIAWLPAPLWSELTALERLDLSHNNIEAISSDTFSRLRALVELDLSGNNIAQLPDLSFSGLRKLSSLSLSHNRLTGVSAVSLVGAGSLRRLSLSHNRLSWAPERGGEWFDEQSSPLNMLVNLQELDLSYNNISVIYSDWRLVLRSLGHLDLSHNSLAELSQADMQFLSSAPLRVDVSYNRIASVQPRAPWQADVPPGAGAPALVFVMDHNPLRCDCMLLDFVQEVQTGGGRYSAEAAKCVSPATLANVSVPRVAARELTCPMHDVTACSCLIRALYRRVECDCPRLEDVPDISSTGLQQLWLRVRRAPPSSLRLPPTVTSLALPHLALTRVPPAPAHVQYMDLSHNLIHTLTERDLQTNITYKLDHNKLDCDCFATDNVKLIQKYSHKIVDYANLTCSDGTLIKLKDANAICDIYKSYVSGTLIAVFLILVASLITLVYIYRVEIQVIMYRNKWCMFLLPGDEEERDKTYDVFLSFAHEDEKFVLSEILPRLGGYSLLVQGRDWEVGGTIPEQIHKSVEGSRRTVIVLTEQYLKSRWSREVFRSVRAQTAADRRHRAVTLLTAVSRRQLDSDVKTHLALSTFIKYKESLFWDKLRYALPRKDMYRDAAARDAALRASVVRVGDVSVGGRGKAAWSSQGLQVVRNEEGKLINMAYVKDV